MIRACCILLLIISLLPLTSRGQVANWTGDGDGVTYGDPMNWDIGQVPINSGGSNFNVIVPNGVSLTFDTSGQISE